MNSNPRCKGRLVMSNHYGYSILLANLIRKQQQKKLLDINAKDRMQGMRLFIE